MNSMTGFGHQDHRDEHFDITVEIKTVNHRYKDFFIKIPRILNANEEKIRKKIGETLARGRIEVFIRLNELNNDNTTLNVNHSLVRGYLDALGEITEMDERIDPRISLSLIAKFPDVIEVQEEAADDDVLWQALEPVLADAIAQVATSRAREGLAMKADISRRCDTIEAIVKKIETKAPEMVAAFEKNLREKVSDYLASTEIDDQRILTEVAIMGDRLAVDEELTRLNTHIGRLKEMIEITSEPIGRKLDFLIQEMNREINTIGSKVNDVAITGMVVDVKNEIEKIREQIQNIE